MKSSSLPSPAKCVASKSVAGLVPVLSQAWRPQDGHRTDGGLDCPPKSTDPVRNLVLKAPWTACWRRGRRCLRAVLPRCYRRREHFGGGAIGCQPGTGSHRLSHCSVISYFEHFKHLLISKMNLKLYFISENGYNLNIKIFKIYSGDMIMEKSTTKIRAQPRWLCSIFFRPLD